MSRYSVIVDSSIWVEFFKHGNVERMDFLIQEDLVCVNDIILSELLPFLHHKKERHAIDALESVRSIPLNVDWEGIRNYQLMNLKNGVNKVGLADLIILQQVIDQRLILFSFDKHFSLMKDFLKFDLLEK